MKRRALLKQELFPEADVRPTLLGIVTLLFLLLFFLLSTSTGQRLGVVDVRAAAIEMATLPHTGLLKEVQVAIQGGVVTVTADVQTTDIAAAATSTERRVISIPPREDGRADLRAVGEVLQTIHDIDPTQEKIVLVPEEGTTVEALFGVMDAARGSGGVPLFPRLTLGGQGS